MPKQNLTEGTHKLHKGEGPSLLIKREKIPWVSKITADAIKHFAWGIGDNNPLWHQTPTIAPPCLLYAVDETTVAPGHSGLPRVYEGVEWTWYNVATVGTTIKAEAQLIDEQSDNDNNIIQKGSVSYLSNGQLIAAANVRCARPIESASIPTDQPEIRYSPEELEKAETAILQEKRTGASQHLWEKVEEGEKLGPLIKGPLSIMDIVAWCAGTQGGPDENNNQYSDGGLLLQTATGPQQVAWMAHLLTDWAGDNGFLHQLNAEIYANPPLGSTTTISGQVNRRTISEGLALIHLVTEAKDQDGKTTATATAKVALESEENGPVALPILGS